MKPPPEMPLRLRFLGALMLCFLGASALAQAPAQPQVLSIPGAGPPTALLRALASAFNQGNAPNRIEVPQTIGMAGAFREALGGSPLARMPRRLTDEEEKQGLKQIVIARQALVFVTGSDVSVTGLSRAQLADAFSGRVSKWSDFGGAATPIRAFYREEAAESMRQIRRLLPEFIKLEFSPQAKIIHVESALPELMQRFHWSLGWMSLENAHAATGLRVLALDGIAPSVEALRSGKYPLYLDAVLIFKAQPTDLAREFLDFVASPAGRAVIEAQGSLPVGRP